MTKYYCLDCGWEGEDIIEWEEHPRDEFWYKCPKCHHTDMNIMKFDGEVWIPAVVCREPTSEEVERSERVYNKLNRVLTSNNVYLESMKRWQKERGEE